MKLLCISDLHGDSSALDRILEDAGAVDIVLLGGDITHFGTPNAAEHLVRRAWEACAKAGLLPRASSTAPSAWAKEPSSTRRATRPS